MKINEFIVVGGKDGTERIKSIVDCNTIEISGSTIDTYTSEVIRHAQQTRGVIILTDPGFPSDKIRNTIREHVSGAKHAHIDREKAKSKRGRIGIGHADIKDIQEALMHVSSPLEEAKEAIDKNVLIDLGLIIGKDIRYRGNILGQRLCIGHSSGRQLLKRLNAFGYIEDDIRKTLSEKEEN